MNNGWTNKTIRQLEAEFNIAINNLSYRKGGSLISTLVNDGIIDQSASTISEWYQIFVKPALAKYSERKLIILLIANIVSISVCGTLKFL